LPIAIGLFVAEFAAGFIAELACAWSFVGAFAAAGVVHGVGFQLIKKWATGDLASLGGFA
ncbi:MAG: hypothetical protein EBQ80_05655, partial [Proteobacteria bacterium]|nr:hypothetical protein [Pseudomonadota bacterium]